MGHPPKFAYGQLDRINVEDEIIRFVDDIVAPGEEVVEHLHQLLR